MYFDTHLHLTQLTHTNFPQELNSQPYKALSVSTNLHDALANISLSKTYTNIIPAVGLHPWNVSSKTVAELDELLNLVKLHNVSCLGEIGLDFLPRFITTKELQLEVFETQLAFAYENNLAVSIHLYKGYQEAYSLLKQYPVQGALHGFVGGLELAKQFSSLGLLIGVNPVILRDNAPRYHRLVEALDLSQLVIETDAPYIRSEICDEQDLSCLHKVAAKISYLKNLPLETVLQQTFDNAQRVFNKNAN